MSSDQKQVVLGVDLDGVCADFYGQMREFAAEWFERPIDELTPDVTYGHCQSKLGYFAKTSEPDF